AWAEQGISLKVAFKGIDRYFDRQQHKPRRRPVPLQFCEADILDAFAEWKRAVGLSASAARSLATPAADLGDGGSAPVPDSGPRSSAFEADSTPYASGSAVDAVHASRKPGMPTHIDRVMARLTQRWVEISGTFGASIDQILGRLDVLRADAKGL